MGGRGFTPAGWRCGGGKVSQMGAWISQIGLWWYVVAAGLCFVVMSVVWVHAIFFEKAGPEEAKDLVALTLAQVPQDKDWHHVDLVFDGGASAGYVDGERVVQAGQEGAEQTWRMQVKRTGAL